MDLTAGVERKVADWKGDWGLLQRMCPFPPVSRGHVLGLYF